MTKIILMRHGETVWNTLGRWQGHAPTPLSEDGILQVQHAAQNLYQHQPLDAIYSSDLLRAQQTAKIVAEIYQLPINLEPRLREINLGAWQGLTREEIMAWDSERYQALWQQHHLPRPGGESLQQVGQRANDAIQMWLKEHPNQVILGVTHGGTIRGLLYHLGLSDGNSSTNIKNTSLTTLIYEDGIWHLENIGQVTFYPNLDCEE
ncbi:MAG: hypothetical protein CUN55_13520 [Phototrophicales bacterium]|nr:MAG: hypothetical protein CUN55_13520 [Phototrophicales bacterium]